MRTQQLRSAEAALICHLLVAGGQVVAASGASDLSDGQIAGVVIGSVGGALLLGLLTFFICCLRASRRRQTGDLTWAKSADVEVAAISQTPHQPLSGPCADDLAESARRATAAAGGGPNADASFHNVCRTDASTVTGEGQSATTFEVGGGVDLTNLPPSPLDGSGGSSRKMGGFFRGRGQGGGGGNVAQFFVVPKGLLRNHNGGPKDKHLQVSRSARVEPSAELEMAEPFQPAATNMGPPLSKSSMLLRWLNGADEGLPEAAAAAAAQAAAAADGASGRSGGKGATARGAGGGGRGGGGAAGLGTSLDRLPLLSLAAQQTGIVWSKMPPSVASSPAVSVVESSSMFMLKGTLKRSDALEDTASSGVHGHSQTLSHAAAALAAWHGGDGDDRYPASLAQASLQSFTESGAQRRGDGGSTAAVAAGSAGSGGGTGGGRVGIVFDYVMRRGGGGPGSSSSRTTTTAGGASSRAPTIGGGAVLPVSSSGGGADPNAPYLGFGADDAFMMGALPDENMLAQAQALNRTSPRPWLHQTPPTKLTALQEADEGEEAAPAPQPSPAPSSKQLVAPVVMLSPSPVAAGRPPAPAAPVTPLQMTHGSAQVASPGWTHFGDGEASPATVAGAAAAVAARGLQGSLASDPPASSRLAPEPPLPVSTIAAVAAGNGQFAFGSAATAAGDGSAYSRLSASELPVGNVIGGLPDVEGVAAAGGDGGGGDVFRTPGGRLPAAAAAPPVSPSASPRASSSHLLGRRGATPSPLPLQACQSSASLRSQTSLASPSMGVHYPDLTPEAFGSQRQGSGAVGSISEATDSAAPLSGNSGPPSARAL